MGEISKQLFINAPLDKVWTIWTDVEKTPQWVDGVQSSRITGFLKEGKGLEWQEKCLIDGRAIDMEHEFTEWELHKKTVTHTKLPMGGFLNRTAEFKTTPQGSEIQFCLQWDLGMMGMLVEADKVHGVLEKSLIKTGEKWKERAEKT